VGDRFGRYELLRRLGSGGMAEVFAAKTFGAEGFVKDVVIKRILPAFSEDPDFVQMFINEARLAARLQHANVVQIFDFNHVDGIYYIAMELVDGLDLRSMFGTSRRRAIPVPVRLAVHVGVETLKGLHYAHTRSDNGKPLGLVHRDISPHNLLVSFAGEVKITDFGIAKAAAIASATRSGAVKGKLAYMSPEQIRSAPVDARSDLFSLGVVLWELLAGQRLYQADSEGELFAKVRRADVPQLRPLGAELPPDLERVVGKLLAPEPDQRFQSAAEALGELSRFAGVDDALQVASYLRKLLPAEAARERRGDTQVDPQQPTEPGGPAIPTAPDAPLRPVDSTAATAPEPLARAAHGADAGPAVSTARASRRWALAAGCLGCFSLFALAGYWIVSRPPAPPATASLLVESEPPGAAIWADNLLLGTAPLQVEGPPGKELRLQARWEQPSGRQDQTCQLGSTDRLRIRRAELAPPRAESRSPDASVAPASHLRPKSDRRRPPRRPRPERPVRAGEAERRRVGTATLDVLVAPWARVRIDGREHGQTPLKNIELPAGPHTVRITNPELGKDDTEKLRLKPGQHAVIRRKWMP
jgi:hypothetical protein